MSAVALLSANGIECVSEQSEDNISRRNVSKHIVEALTDKTRRNFNLFFGFSPHICSMVSGVLAIACRSADGKNE